MWKIIYKFKSRKNSATKEVHYKYELNYELTLSLAKKNPNVIILWHGYVEED